MAIMTLSHRRDHVNRFHDSEVSDLGRGGAAASTAAGARTTPPARRGREGADADAARRQAMMAESDRVYAVAQGAVPAARPPDGYSIIDTPPAVDFELKDEYVLFKWNGTPVPQDKFGWYHGKVVGDVSAATKRKDPARR